MTALRGLELLFFCYFSSHIPITLFIDLQALLPAHVFPQPAIDLMRWYAEAFRDPLVLDPPVWFRSFILCEALLQLPFFPVAAIAFLKGGCRWIRTPAIIYSAHVASTLVPILAHILFSQFPTDPPTGPPTGPPSGPPSGPQTPHQRWLLASVYAPYLLVPLLLLLTMLTSSTYCGPASSGSGPASSGSGSASSHSAGAKKRS